MTRLPLSSNRGNIYLSFDPQWSDSRCRILWCLLYISGVISIPSFGVLLWIICGNMQEGVSIWCRTPLRNSNFKDLDICAVTSLAGSIFQLSCICVRQLNSLNICKIHTITNYIGSNWMYLMQNQHFYLFIPTLLLYVNKPTHLPFSSCFCGFSD